MQITELRIRKVENEGKLRAVFKGSGFYSTDNRSPSGQTPVHHESSASEEIPHGSAEKKTESGSKSTEAAKPAASSDSKDK